MQELKLPHDHGDAHDIQYLHSELEKIDRFAAAAEMFRQIADPTRIRIFWLLCHREECVINISALLGMSSPAVSHHLRALKDCGLVTSRREGKEVYYTLADTRLCHMLHPAVEQIMDMTCPPSSTLSHEQLARTVHQYLLDHLAERITLEDIARQFHVNSTTVKQAFRQVYGDSVAAHILGHRMEAAERMLRAGDRSVAQIARAVGFQSQSRFADAFKKTYGVLPTQYRRQER